jgi:hypothetical protein
LAASDGSTGDDDTKGTAAAEGTGAVPCGASGGTTVDGDADLLLVMMMGLLFSVVLLAGDAELFSLVFLLSVATYSVSRRSVCLSNGWERWFFCTSVAQCIRSRTSCLLLSASLASVDMLLLLMMTIDDC